MLLPPLDHHFFLAVFAAPKVVTQRKPINKKQQLSKLVVSVICKAS